MFFDNNKNVIADTISGANITRSANVWAVSKKMFMTPSNCYYMRFYCTEAYGNIYNHDISINYPSTITKYEPYDGNTYTAHFIAPTHKNLFDFHASNVTFNNNTQPVDIDNGVRVSITTAGTYLSSRWTVSGISKYANQSLTFSAKSFSEYSSCSRIIAKYVDASGGTIGNTIFEITTSTITKTFTVPSDLPSNAVLRFYFYASGSASMPPGVYVDYTDV